MPPVTLPPSISPFDDSASDGPGSHGGANSGNTGSGKNGKGLSGGAIAAIVVTCVVVVALVAGGVWYFLSRGNGKSAELALCTTEQSTYEKALDELHAEVANGQQVISSLSGQVSDTAALDKLQQALDDAGTVNAVASCDASMSADDLKTNMQTFRDATQQAEAKTKTVKDAADTANTNADAQNAAALKAVLSGVIEQAQNTLNDSAGSVADENTRTALQNAIANANNVFGQSQPTQADVDNAKSQLEKAMSDVNASIAAKQQADAEKEQNQPSDGNGTTGTGDGADDPNDAGMAGREDDPNDAGMAGSENDPNNAGMAGHE